MPIYEYACENCGHGFEELVLTEKIVACPVCQSKKVLRLLSSFSSPKIAVSELNIFEAGYDGSAEFNDKLQKGELEDPVKARKIAIKDFREKSPLFKKGRRERKEKK